MRKKIEIPPKKCKDYPVDVHLRIHSNGERYELQIQALGRKLRGLMNMTPHDLLELNQKFQDAIYSISGNNLEKPPIPKYLSDLAEIGRYAFIRIFDDSNLRTLIERLIHLGNSISIEVASEVFALPWEFIYSNSLDESFSYENFWGMKHIISRQITQNTRPEYFVLPTISLNAQPRLGILTYNGLPGVVENELHFFEQLQDADKLKLIYLQSLDPHNRQEELQEFIKFWDNNLNLAHFACHANYDFHYPTQSHFILSEEFPITLMEIETRTIQIDGHPLIIMNACETGNLNPLYTSNFAAVFLKSGARGVVATECSIPDTFAADFAEQLYTHFLSGESLGDSLLAARRYFLEHYNNPSGLIYSMYASPSTRLVKAGDSN